METLLLFFAFLFGTIIGSFLNSLVFRRKTGLSLMKRSRCFSCGHELSVRDLVPLASFVASRGRCRYCKSKIALQYPLVELLSGIVFAALFLKLYPPLAAASFPLKETAHAAYYAAIFSLLMAISVYDVRHKIIPDEFAYIFAALSLTGAFVFGGPEGESVTGILFAGPLLAAPFAALWLFSEGRWMGLGDAKLALGIGWLLGASGGLSALIASFWAGALAGIFLILCSKLPHLFRSSKRLTMKSELPFGPFLALGTFVVFLFEIRLVDIGSLLL